MKAREPRGTKVIKVLTAQRTNYVRSNRYMEKTYEIYVSYKPFCFDTLNEFDLLQRKSE